MRLFVVVAHNFIIAHFLQLLLLLKHITSAIFAVPYAVYVPDRDVLYIL